MSESVLDVENLSKVYHRRGKDPVVAVEGVSFSVRRGEVVGLLGANGAGKTTTIKSMCTLIRPTSGRVTVCGADTVAHPRRALRHIAAVLEGNRNIYWTLSPRQNMEFFAGLQGIPRQVARPYVQRLIESFRLEAKADTPARMLSRGMQQKLAIGCALVKHTDVLLLDEPTLGLDVKTSHELRDILRDIADHDGRTVLLSSHDMHVVQAVCDRVIVIHRGRVVNDERVSTLLATAAPTAVRVTVEGGITDAQEAGLRQLLGTHRMRGLDRDTRAVDVEVPEADGLYAVIEGFRAAGASIRTIERRAPNLEEVFLTLTRDTDG
jgi:ABC-2 type transport system ATP-binding protein